MKKRITSGLSKTDWEKVDETADEEIDYTGSEPMDARDFARGVVRHGLRPVKRKTQLTIRIDSDVLEWYKGLGTGYQTRINSLLRAYMEANRS